MNPFLSFCLFVAGRVFVRYIRTQPKDQHVRASLHFIISAMQIIRRRNPLTDSFLAQLDVDLEVSGIDSYSIMECGPTEPIVSVSPMSEQVSPPEVLFHRLEFY